MRRVVPTAAVAVVALASVGIALGVMGPFTVSGNPSPVGACSAPAAGGTVFNNTEVEPFNAVNPLNSANQIAVWQQDRWSNGGAHALMAAASFDGGHTWSAQTALPFNVCSPAPNALAYERASDPWVSIGPDGHGGSVAYAISISFNRTNNDNAVAAVRSTNGGTSWDHLNVIRADNDQNQFFNDKESLTADPTRPNTAYAVWDQLAGPVDNPAVLAHNLSSFTGPSYFSKTTDGGVTWSPSKIIVPMRERQQSIANVIVVAPNGDLYDFFTLITGTGPNSGPNSTAPHGDAIAFIKSTDAGETWSPTPTIVQQMDVLTVRDPNTGAPLRTSDFNAASAVDPVTGKLYLVWQDARDTTGPNGKGAFSRILMTTSANGGDTWTDPVAVSNSPKGISAFLPAIAVSSNGTVGLTYYDFRTLAADNTTTLPTDIWFNSAPGGSFSAANEKHVTGPFNFLEAPFAGGFFLGDYEGLAAAGAGFVGVDDITNCNTTDCGSNPTDTDAFALP
jgi:hypothetical protein